MPPLLLPRTRCSTNDGAVILLDAAPHGASRAVEPRRLLARYGPAAACLVALLTVALWQDWQFRHYWLDDPFISFRYAWNLVHGHGLTYNPGEHVEGFSNPSWTLLSAGALAAGLDPVLVSKALGLSLHLALIVLVWSGARRRVPRCTPGAMRFADLVALLPAALAAALVATSGWTALWALAGLETPLFAFALAAAVVAYSRERRTAAAALLLLAALTRLEGVVFGLAFVVVLLREQGLSRQAKRSLLIFLVPFTAVLLGRIAYYGHPLPNSYTDKTGLPLAAGLHAGTRYLTASLRTAWGAPVGLQPLHQSVMPVLGLLVGTSLALLWGLARASTARGAARWLAAAFVWLVVAITVGGGGDWMPAARFLVPAVPLVALALGWALTALLDHRPLLLASVHGIAAATGVVVSAAVVLMLAQGQQANVRAAVARYQPSGSPAVYRNPRYVAMAAWLRENARPGDLVGIEEAGLIPYETPQLRYLDLFGLTDETIARGQGTPPFDKHDDTYVLALRPRYLVIWGVPDARGGFRWSHQLSLVEDRRFTSAYRPRLTTAKDPIYTFIVYERR